MNVILKHRNSGAKKVMELGTWDEFKFTEAGKVYRVVGREESIDTPSFKYTPPELDTKLKKRASGKAD